MHFPWLILVCALTGEPTHNPGALRRCSNQLATGPGPRAAFLGTPVTPPPPLVVPVQLGALTHSLDFHPASGLLFSGCIPGHLRECGRSTHCTPRLLLGWSRRGGAGGGAQSVLRRELSPAHISSLRPTCPTPPTQAPLAVPLAPLVLKQTTLLLSPSPCGRPGIEEAPLHQACRVVSLLAFSSPQHGTTGHGWDPAGLPDPVQVSSALLPALSFFAGTHGKLSSRSAVNDSQSGLSFTQRHPFRDSYPNTQPGSPRDQFSS